MPNIPLIPALFDCLRHVLEKTPEIAHVAEAAGAVGIAAAIGPVALPLAIAGPTIVEQYARHRENRPEPEALAELFRESLLHAVEELTRSYEEALRDGSLPDSEKQIRESDRDLLELWAKG